MCPWSLAFQARIVAFPIKKAEGRFVIGVIGKIGTTEGHEEQGYQKIGPKGLVQIEIDFLSFSLPFYGKALFQVVAIGCCPDIDTRGQQEQKENDGTGPHNVFAKRWNAQGPVKDQQVFKKANGS